MKSGRVLRLLETLGLSENEAAVYMAALSLGPTTAANIARVSGVKRPTVYSITETLKKRGLLSTGFEGLKRVFVAEDPSSLKSVLEDQNRVLEEVLPTLNSLFVSHGGETNVEYYEGLQSVKNAYDATLKDLRRGDEYFAISNTAQWQSLDERWFVKFMERRAKLPVKVRLLLQSSAQALYYQEFSRNYNFEVKLLPKVTSLSASIAVTPQRVLIHQLIEPVTAVSIESASVVKTHQEMFAIMWNAL